jgi:uncharacterized protein YgbK (DUF1537 family)
MFGRVAVVADDLTGASDAAVAFAAMAAGQVHVVFEAPARWPAEAAVVAVDLDVREAADTEARARVAATLPTIAGTGARVLLKIDSTLRGPLNGFIQGALEASAARLAVIAPAFPAQGRLLTDGRVRVHGAPGASLPDVIGMRETALIGATTARLAPQLEQAIEHAAMRGARRVIVDTDGPDCLDSVARLWPNHPDWLLVGSAGLTHAVAGASSRPVELPKLGRDESVLVVAGSPAEATRAQLARLLAVSPACERLWVLATHEPIGARDTGQAARAVAGQGVERIRQLRPAAVVIAGGATARAMLDLLHASGLRLLGEVQPGIAIGRLVGGEADGTLVITKAGGFGGPEALLDVLRALGVSSIKA